MYKGKRVGSMLLAVFLSGALLNTPVCATQEGTLVGEVVSFDSQSNEVSLSLLSGSNVVYSTTVVGNETRFEFGKIASGSYTLRAEKAQHVTREYQIAVGSSKVEQDIKLLMRGDVTQDGKVNIGDTANIYAHVRKTKSLTDPYILECANTNKDSKVNIGDVGRVYGDLCNGITVSLYTVTFKDYNDVVLKTQTVAAGDAVTPPPVPNRYGFTFTGWDQAFSNVTSNLTVTATYTQSAPSETFTVTFYDDDGSTVLGTAEVAKGATAMPPAVPSKTGADFLGWSGNYTNVSHNESVVAVYDDSKNVFMIESASGNVGSTVTLLVSVDGKVKTCGFDMTIFYDNAVLELLTYDADLDLDVLANTQYYDNGVILNFSATSDKTKSREIIALTFKIKETAATATSLAIEMTSIKEMNGSTIIDSSFEIVEGVVTVR